MSAGRQLLCAKGHQTRIELVTDILRDRVPGGEKLVSFVRDTLFAYIYQSKAESSSVPVAGMQRRPVAKAENGPAPALVDTQRSNRPVKPEGLGIEIAPFREDGMLLGNWYGVQGNPGIFVSVLSAEAIAPALLQSYKAIVADLRLLEARQLVYLIAFDLDRFDLKYALGTDHPRVGWSERIQSRMKDDSQPGPDGIV